MSRLVRGALPRSQAMIFAGADIELSVGPGTLEVGAGANRDTGCPAPSERGRATVAEGLMFLAGLGLGAGVAYWVYEDVRRKDMGSPGLWALGVLPVPQRGMPSIAWR